MNELQWPSQPTTHAAYTSHQAEWRTRNNEPYRTCSYCGGVHPEDLLTMIRDGATLGGSDWKYGLPHKFYVYRNPLGGYPKWYSEHLFDQGYNEAALQQLLDVLTCHTGIRWTVDDKGEIRYNAPYHGYQRSGYA